MKTHTVERTGFRMFLSICAAAVILLSGTMAGAQAAGEPAPLANLEAGSIAAFQQLAPGLGWLLFDGRLYFTQDDGGNWLDVSPPETGRLQIVAVAFLDPALGWVALTDGGPFPAVTLARTEDGGATWQAGPADLPGLTEALNPVTAVTMGWNDPLHGWLAFKLASGSNFSLGLLFTTQDGGETWQAQEMPLGEPAYFVSARAGWVAGGPAGDQLYRTADGGATWQALQIPGLQDGGLRLSYHLPRFDDEERGLLPVVTQDGESVSVDFYRTGDGGATWTLAGRVPLEPDTPLDAGLPLTLLDGGRFSLAVPNSDRVAWMDGGQVSVRVNADGASAGIVALSMSTLDSGWAKWAYGECLPADGSDPGGGLNCVQETRLLGTGDGGQHWAPLALPGASGTTIQQSLTLESKTPEVQETQEMGMLGALADGTQRYTGHGFDKCEIASLSQMQTWWNSSPYNAVNLYIGGSARACANSALSASFLSQLYAQGWRFIPTWVGPQASCTGYSSRMSSNINTAYNQGIAEADKALAVAVNLGLAGADKSGTIIYYDLEGYNTADSACRAAANSFISGWVGRMRAFNSQAGAYGSVCASAISDWATIVNVPDAVWLANWYYDNYYRPNASVWGVSCVSDSLWSNRQRLRQYTGGHNQTWGGVTMNIDSNVLDGILAVPYGNANPSAAPAQPVNRGPTHGTTLARTSDIWINWKTTGDTCSLRVWGGSIDITTTASCTTYRLGVRPGGAYSWQVTASNASGATVGPVWRFDVKPHPATGLSVASVSSTKVNLKWQLSADDSANLDGYLIYMDGQQVASVGKGVSTYQVANIPCVTSHSFYVTAVRQGVRSDPTGTVSATTATCAPVTVSPEDEANLADRRPVLTWQAVEDATGYDVQASLYANFSSPAINKSVSDTFYAHTADLAINRLYYWRVRSKGPYGLGDWSTVMRFTTPNPPAAPGLALPGNNALVTTTFPLLDWKDAGLPAGTSLDRYQVQVAADTAFTFLLADEYAAASEIVLPDELLPNGKYYWRVRAYNTYNQIGSWSGVWSFRTAITAPVLETPADGSIHPSLQWVFDWSDAGGASSYTIQVSAFEDFSRVLRSATPKTSIYTLSGGLPVSSTLYWRVRANGTNGPSLWSPTWSFTTANPPGIPGLVSPGNNALMTTYKPRLDWSTVKLPVDVAFGHYHLQVAADNVFANLALEQEVTDHAFSEFTLTADLLPNSRYYWRVRSFNAAGEHSGWSGVWSFRTAILPPVLSLPANEVRLLDRRPILDWEDVEGASGYNLQISRYQNFSQVLFSANPKASVHAMTGDLPANTLLYWRVRAAGANGPSAWSQSPRTFTTANPPGIPGLVSPGNNALTTNYKPRLDWSTVKLPVDVEFGHYHLQVAADNAFANLSLEQEVTDHAFSEFTLTTDLLPNSRYYWRVRSFNAAGEYSGWSGVWSFRTAILPPVLSLPAEEAILLDRRPFLDWEDVPAASGYNLQISRYANFSQILFSANPKASVHAMTGDLPANTPLYWRVRATGANGPSAWSQPARTFTTANPPGIPGLVLPANNALVTDYNPRLDWSTVALPVDVEFGHYHLQVAADAAFANLVLEEDVEGLEMSEFTPVDDLLLNVKYYWRVRSFNAAGETSSWSAVRYFRTAILPPVLSSPPDGEPVPTRRPLLDWADVEGATGYDLQVSIYETFGRVLFSASPKASLHAMTSDLPVNTTLYWRVRATGPNGPSAWSQPFSTSTTANPPGIPGLVTPGNNALVTTYRPRLDWSTVTLPAGTEFGRYHLQVAADAAFANLVLEQEVADQAFSEFTLVSDLLPNTRYYWRVRSFNAAGEYSGWSAARYFRTAILPPVLSLPANEPRLLDRRPLLDWEDVEGATGYNLQISIYETFSRVLFSANPKASVHAMTSDLPANTLLYWRVRATGANGPSAWSQSPRTFTTANPPGIPGLVSPGNNALVTNYKPRLDWSTVTVPAGTAFGHYRLQVASDNAFANLVLEQEVADQAYSEFTLTADLLPNSRYYWRVRSFNAAGETSAWSGVWSFRTAILPPVLSSPLGTDLLLSSRPVLDWEDVPAATGYNIHVSRYPTFSSYVLSASSAASVYTPTVDLPANTLLYWRVQAKGSNGPSAWSPVWSFTTPNPPGIPALVSPANNALVTTHTPRLDWSTATLPAGTAFSHYQLQVAADAAFTALALDQDVPGLEASEFTPLSDLLPNTRYYWRVRTFNTLGQYNPWSGVWSFRTVILPPALIGPGGGAALPTSRPPFDWGDVAGAGSYTLQVSRSPGFSTSLVVVTVSGSEYLPPVNLPAGTTLYWRVRANGTNGPSAWSEVEAFSIE